MQKYKCKNHSFSNLFLHEKELFISKEISWFFIMHTHTHTHTHTYIYIYMEKRYVGRSDKIMENKWKSGYTKTQTTDSVQNISFFLYFILVEKVMSIK